MRYIIMLLSCLVLTACATIEKDRQKICKFFDSCAEGGGIIDMGLPPPPPYNGEE